MASLTRREAFAHALPILTAVAATHHDHATIPPPPRFEPVTIDEASGWIFPTDFEQDYGPLTYMEVVRSEDGTPELVIVPRWCAPQVLESGPQPLPIKVQAEDREITRVWRSQDVAACKLCRSCRANDTSSRYPGQFECRVSLRPGAIPDEILEDEDTAAEYAALWSEKHDGPLPDAERGGQTDRFEALRGDAGHAADLAEIWWPRQDATARIRELAKVCPSRWLWESVEELTREGRRNLNPDPWGELAGMLADRHRAEGGGR